jgi:hypothetical protein
VIVILFLGIQSCQECEQCNTSVSEPRVSLVFFNVDSLESVLGLFDDQLELADSLTQQIATLNNDIAILNDSLNVLEAAIDTGNTDFNTTIQEIERLLSQDSIQLALRQDELVTSDSIINQLNTIQNEILSGSVKIDGIENVSNGSRITYDDSLDIYDIPLNIAGSVTLLEIEIQEAGTFELEISHKNEERVSTDRKIEILMSEITLVSHSFDSVIVVCANELCRGNETALNCFF